MKDFTAPMATPPAQTGPSVPFDVVEIQHNVKDYDKWRLVFNTDSTNRKGAGLTDVAVGRSVGKPNDGGNCF